MKPRPVQLSGSSVQVQVPDLSRGIGRPFGIPASVVRRISYDRNSESEVCLSPGRAPCRSLLPSFQQHNLRNPIERIDWRRNWRRKWRFNCRSIDHQRGLQTQRSPRARSQLGHLLRA